MKNNEFYQKAKVIATKFEQAKQDYKPHKVRGIQQESLKEVKALINQYKGQKDALRSERQQELKTAKEHLDSVESKSVFEIIKNCKIDFETLDKQEKLQRYFAAKFAQINSPQDLELAVNELVSTNDATAISAFKMAYSQTDLPFLKEVDNKYLRATNRIGMQQENLAAIQTIDEQIKKIDTEHLKITNPEAYQAKLNFSEAQANLQSAMGFNTDDVLNGLNQVFNEIDGFGGNGIDRPSDKFFS